MSQMHDLDQLLSDWLADESPRDTSARVVRAAISETERTKRLRPLPTLIATLKGDPLETTMRPWTVPWARPAFALLLALLTLALAAGALIVGSRLGLDRLLPQHALLLASPAPVGGGLLAFDSGGDLYLATADGTVIHPITDDPATEVGPSWAPDGHRLASWKTDGTAWTLVVRDLVADTSLEIPTTGIPWMGDPETGPAWSPDGRLVAWAADGAPDLAIYVVNADGSAEPVAFSVPGSGVYDPVFSPDGTRLSFAAVTGDGTRSLQVATVNPAGAIADLVEISHGSWEFPGEDNGFRWEGASFARSAWSPDGRRLVTLAGTSGTGGDLLVIAADGSEQHAPFLDDRDNGPGSWSPDGASIAYLRHIADGPEQDQLLVGGADGTDARVIDGLPLVYSMPEWSPDGTLLAVRSALRDSLAVAPVDPAAPVVTIPVTAIATDPSWQPVPVVIPGMPAAGD